MDAVVFFEGTGSKIDMSHPATLWGQVLADFPGYRYLQRGDGDTQPLLLQSSLDGVPGHVDMYGDITYRASGNADGTSPITSLLVYGENDTGGLSSVKLFHEPAWTFAKVWNALSAHDLSPLLAGSQLFIHGDTRNDTLVGGTLNDHLYGGGANDRLMGRGGDDWLEGNAGADNLIGGDGADSLSGGSGHDTLTGGAGADLFAFWEATSSSGSSDTFTDFEHGVDDIQFSYLAFPTVGGAPASTLGDKFISATDIGATSGGTGVDPNDRVLYDSDSGKLYYDTNGNMAGGRVLIATVLHDGAPAVLTADDFSLDV